MTDLLRDGHAAAAVAAAVAALRAGSLVGLPTETVYGLAADAGSAAAVERIFAVKRRPRDHPLILHVAADAEPARWAVGIPAYVTGLVRHFWPGPLTVVLPKRDAVADFVTGGQPTVALRSPDHPVAQQLLSEFGGAVAAPSANRFGGVSPTSAADVVAELSGRLDPGRDIVLDGGACRVGVESTIVDCTGPEPRVLRPGGIGLAELAVVTGTSVGAAPGAGDSAAAESGAARAAGEVRVPGMLASHYSPAAAVLLAHVGAGESELLALAGTGTSGGQPGLIAPAEVPTPPGWLRLQAPVGLGEYAHGLYRALRAADAHRLAVVVAVPPAPGSALAAAVADRLARAAA